MGQAIASNKVSAKEAKPYLFPMGIQSQVSVDSELIPRVVLVGLQTLSWDLFQTERCPIFILVVWVRWMWGTCYVSDCLVKIYFVMVSENRRITVVGYNTQGIPS